MKTKRQITPRSARARTGMPLRMVAERAGIDISTIHRAEKAGRWPGQYRTRMALLAALGLAERDGQVVEAPAAPAGGAA